MSNDYAYLQSMEEWNIQAIIHPPPLLETRAKLGEFLTINEPRLNKGHAAELVDPGPVQQTPADVSCTGRAKTPPIFANVRHNSPPRSFGEPAGSSSIPRGFDPVDPADTGDPRNRRRR